MKVYIAYRTSERKWVQEIMASWLEKRDFEPVFIIEDGWMDGPDVRWRALDACEVVLVLDSTTITTADYTPYVEMGLMMGWARHVIVRGAHEKNILARMPWVIHAEGPELEGLEEAFMKLRSRLLSQPEVKE